MTTDYRQLLTMALDALEVAWNYVDPYYLPLPEVEEAIDALKAALAEPTGKESLTPHPSIIDSIADNLLQDHVELMVENKRLRESLREILHENYPPEHYTDETIEYENEQGNMMMPAVKRAYALIGREEQ